VRIFNKRNALIGWALLILARRRSKQHFWKRTTGQARRRALVAGAGLVVGATAIALYARRGQADSPAGA
jgi:hypothetical protein